MNRADLNAEIDRQLKARGEFRMIPGRPHRMQGFQRVMFSIYKHGNPALAQKLVYSIDGMETDGHRAWDASINKTFDTREQFVDSLLRYINRRPSTRWSPKLNPATAA